MYDINFTKQLVEKIDHAVTLQAYNNCLKLVHAAKATLTNVDEISKFKFDQL